MGRVFAILCPKKSIASKYRQPLQKQSAKPLFKITKKKDELIEQELETCVSMAPPIL
jgi:hypothetical protein